MAWMSKNVLQKHEVDLGHDLSANVGLVPAYPPYNVRKERRIDYAEYKVFGSNAIKDVEKAQQDMRKPGPQGHVFYSAL